jgi:phosphoglycerol transferase MdoB-like AlkP superfamily enzyme
MLSLNFSLPLLLLVGLTILERGFSRKIFSRADWSAAAIFGVGAMLLLYPSALGLTRIDTYSWGWSHSALIALVTGITIFLLWKKNRFGIVLLLSLLAFALHVKDTMNLWDYLIDPIYGVIAFLWLFT